MSLDDSDTGGLCPCSLLILIVITCIKDFITNCRKFLNSAVILSAIFFFLVLLLQGNQTYNFKHSCRDVSLNPFLGYEEAISIAMLWSHFCVFLHAILHSQASVGPTEKKM